MKKPTKVATPLAGMVYVHWVAPIFVMGWPPTLPPWFNPIINETCVTHEGVVSVTVTAEFAGTGPAGLIG